VSGTAIGGNGGANSGDANSGDVPGLGPGAPVSLISNGGVNDAVGGATSGTLNLTQTAIGGNSGSSDDTGATGGNASSTLTGTNPSGASNYNLTANATGGNGGPNAVRVGGAGGSATATVDATSATVGTVTDGLVGLGLLGWRRKKKA
jgi:hypothetical protein